MTIHDMNLRRGPFAAVASGRKCMELRLWDERRQRLQVGDVIRFTCEADGATVSAEVLGLHLFPDFAALYDALLPRFGAVGLGYAPGEDARPEDMLDYYDKARIERYGVVGIEIKLR